MNKNITHLLLIGLVLSAVSITTVSAYSPAEVMSAINPYMTDQYKFTTEPLVNTQTMSGAIYIYKLPTNPTVFVFSASGAIDCDGGSTSICKGDSQGQSDTSLHTSDDRPIDQAFVPGFVLPESPNSFFDYLENDIKLGESGMVIYGNAMTPAIFSDERGLDHNGGGDIGELTYGACVLLGLSSSTCDPNNGGIDNGVTYLVFTGPTNIPSPVDSITAIQENGNNALDVMMAQLNSSKASIPTPVNLIKNTGFESGTTPWIFYTNGKGSFTTVSPGYEGNSAARLVIVSAGTNIQLYQKDITLEPNTRYRLSFAANSTRGHDLKVQLIKHVSPYTGYGLGQTFNISKDWQEFSTEFTTTGFTGTVKDGRLMFYLPQFAVAGDKYYIDNVRLSKV